ncbi:pyridoxal-phosphate dependent enzyme, partial [Streptomyces sp. NPDC093591]|uniref:pyridoxal-phosphate dependent enzyme n=1 Tax=Streptomyces sp. NPDC093591 TaxID=3366044 RepID=UPI003823A17F
AGSNGLLTGITAAAQHHGITTVTVEPEHHHALNGASEAGQLVNVELDPVPADSLGARRTWQAASTAARRGRTHSVLVTDAQLIAARQILWDQYRIAVEHGTAAAFAAVLATEAPARPEYISSDQRPVARSYRPASGEKVAVVLCGANTDPSDLVPPPPVA